MMQLELLQRMEHVAGDRMFPMQPGVTSAPCQFGGSNDCYRYTLHRQWGDPARLVAFILMNPSTARTDMDDRTVAKITRMARRWAWRGIPNYFGRLVVLNTFAYRCTDQLRLAEVKDPIGPENDDVILAWASQADLVVFGYGKPRLRELRARGLSVATSLRDLGVVPYVFRISRDGHPWHPLFVPDETKPIAWEIL